MVNATRLSRSLGWLAGLSLSALLLTSSPALAAETGMTSDTYCNTKLCLQAIYIPSKSQINYTLTTDGGGQGIGWYGVGTGRRMSGSNMMVGWVNPDSSVTLSQRTASGHNTPTTSISSSAMTIDTQLSKSNSSMTVWSWSFPVTSAPSSSEYHIWAYNNQRTPSSSSASSSISEHNAYGTLTLDLTKAYNPTTDSGSSVTTPGSSPSSSSSSNSEGGQSASGDGARVLNSSNKLIIAHMVFMILAWLIVSPLAVLIGRWGRTFFKWFPIHRNLQIVTVLLFAIGFVLILIEVGKEAGAEHFDSNHAKAGLAILILVAIQLVLGQLGHKTKRWNPVRIVHVILGLVTTFLAIWNCAEGLEIWDWQPAKWSRYLVFIWGGLILIAYLAGLTMLPRDLRNSKAAKDSQDHDATAMRMSQRGGFSQQQQVGSSSTAYLNEVHVQGTMGDANAKWRGGAESPTYDAGYTGNPSPGGMGRYGH